MTIKPKSKGWSLYTPNKQKMLIRILNAQLNNIDTSKPFVYIDQCSGPGERIIPEFGTCPLSPKIAHTIFGALPFAQFLLFEHVSDVFDSLETVMKALDDERISLNCTDSKRVVKILEAQHSNERGLIYYDPEGAPQFRTTMAAAKAAPRIDVLVHIGASLIKRQIGKAEAGCNVSEELLIPLDEYVETLGRKHNFITNCHERQQWIFLYSTNSDTFVPPTGMFDITSEDGKILFDFVKNTKVDHVEPENTKNELQSVLSNTDCWASLT